MTQNQTNIKHLAVTLDGNGRWATAHGFPKVEGHRAGGRAIRKLIENVMGIGIPYLTLYGMSSENMLRPQKEVSDIMGIIEYFLNKELDELHKNGVRLKIIGSLDRFSSALREKLHEATVRTQNNTKLTLVTALGYGSRAELTHACASIVRSGIRAEDITEQTVAEHLYDPELPDVDLFIRPGDHIRMSNFLLWQSAYAELFFTKTLWPNFDQKDLNEAVAYFGSCKRNFGYSRDQEH